MLLWLSLLITTAYISRSWSESPTNKLEQFFKTEKNKVIDKNKYNRKAKPLKRDNNYILFEPKTYKMNMEDSVETRWSALCDEYTANYTKIYEYVNNVIESTGTADLIYDTGLKWYNEQVADPYKSEIEYFSICTGVPLQGVIMLNLMEIFLLWGCTGIVCADKDNHIFFARNFDLWLLDVQDELRSIMINIKYSSGKDTLFEGNTFFGYSGIIAGARKYGYSVAMNTRYTNVSIFDCLSMLQYGYLPQSWLARNTLFDYQRYEDALDQFQTVPIVTPCYYIIGGTDYPEGAVISRNFTHSINPWFLETSYLDWYLLQTNGDWWGTAEDDRKDDGIENMELMGRENINEKNLLFEVLSQFETINYGTVGSITMVPSGSGNSVYKTYVVQYVSDVTTFNAEKKQLNLMHNVDNPRFDDFFNTFETYWETYDGVGIAVFAASIFFNMAMCIYWSGAKRSFPKTMSDDDMPIESDYTADESETDDEIA